MARIRIYQSYFNPPSPPAGKVSVPVLRNVNLRNVTTRYDGAMVATGCNQPELWNPPVTVVAVVTSGWEFQQPPLVVRRRSADPESDDLSLDVVGPITAPPQSGWSIVLPNMPTRRRVMPLAALDSLSLPLGLETPSQGYVSLAELKLVRPRVGFADASIDAESWSPLETVASQPWGWSLPPPRPRAVPESVFAGATLDWTTQPSPVGWTIELSELPTTRRLLAASQDQAELYNPPVEVTQPDSGWTVNLPELAPKKRLPQGEFTARIDRPTDDVVVGWSVELPEFPQFKRKQALPEAVGHQPSAIASAIGLGWVCELPLARRFPPRVLAGADLAPQTVNPSQYGWSVTTNDLPQFRRKQALPESASRLDQPQQLAVGYSIVLPSLPQFQRRQAFPELTGRLDPVSAIQAQSLGWVAELPHLARGTYRGGILAGALLAPQVIIQPAQTGWDIVLPDLPQFRRKQALPETTARIDPPSGLDSLGWAAVTPDLPATRRRTLPETVGRAERAGAEVSWGWQLDTPLRAPARRAALPEATGRIDPVSAIQTQSLGWICELPLFARVATYRSGALPGASLAPQTITETAATGWDIVVPDLPQFRRKQARVESLDRIDQPISVVGVVFQEGWSVVLPHLPQFRRKQALPELSGRIDQPVAAFQWGWSVVLPDVQRPLLRRVAVLVGAMLAPQTVERVAVGWTVVLPDLPRLRHAHAPLELVQRLDPQVVVVVQPPSGWSVEPPFLSQVRPAKGGIFAGSFQELPQIEPSTAATSEQTYFIANVGRFMGRRG